MNLIKKATALILMSTLVSFGANAGLLYTFTDDGNDLTMVSSGSINTNNLVLLNDLFGWGGTGVEENGNHDIIGGTDVGDVDVSFGFNQGTDYSPWASATGPFTSSLFAPDVISGNNGFTTYVRENNLQVPGLGVVRADIDQNGIWSTDQSWTWLGTTLNSAGFVAGTYTVTDAITAEFITFQIGDATQVPEPSTLATLFAGLFALLMVRRRKS